MAALIPNISLGKFVKYAMLAGGANDAIIALLLQSAGLEADTALRDHNEIAALLAATNDEATFTNYSRQTLTGVTVTIDDTANTSDVDAVNPAWSPQSNQALGAIVMAYDPDTTGGTTADLIPVFKDDMVLTTASSGTLTYDIAASGFGRAAAA